MDEINNNVNGAAEQLKLRLESMSLQTLRPIGRAVGVRKPTKIDKDVLVAGIMAVAKNEAAPCPKPTRGAPPKSDVYDQSVVQEVWNCRAYYSESEEDRKLRDKNKTQSGLDTTTFVEEESVYSGVLEYSDKYWFLRTKNMQLSSSDDIFVHASFVSRFHLRTGDSVVCRAKRRKAGECPGATFIVSVNGKSPDSPRKPVFESLVPCYPDERFTLERKGGTLTDRVIDLFSPIGKGQRALIVSPPKAGKTTMLADIARSIRENSPETKVIVLLIDERPEEVTDIRRTVNGAEIIYSTFDRGDGHHIHTASLTVEYAKRIAEDGKDVVILLDSITRLTRAYNSVCNSGRILSGGLDPQALVEPKRLFGSARNIEDGGSLTIIATALVDTGSRLDDVIYEEFKSTGNMEIVLSRELAEKRIFPAIDIRASGARKEDLLLNEQELKCAATVRGMLASRRLEVESLYSTMSDTDDNAEFCTKAQTFLKVYNGR